MESIGNKPPLEIEGKFRITSFSRVRKKLQLAGATGPEIQHQRDIYFAHPIRNYSQTDEALRVRYSDNGCTLTYKGPRQEGFILKAREELNLDVYPSNNLIHLLQRLGFSPVHEVTKIREVYLLKEAAISLDKVNGLGKFIEIELIEPHKVLDPELILTRLKELVGVKGAHIPHSYLELLLAKTF